MSNRPSLQSRSWFLALLLAGATWLAVMAVFGRWSWSDWSAPHWLEGDPLEVYARVQIAAEQPWQALASFAHPARLGAPFGADWSGYTVPDRLVFVLTGQLSRATGLVAAAQLVSALGFVLNAVSFFLCARWLGRRWEWAAAFALGFAFCNYNLRWGVTLSLAQTFTLPPLVLLCGYAARPAPASPRPRWLALGAALALWLGLGNPYLAFFAGVVGSGALTLAFARRAPRARLAPLVCFLAVLTLTFVAANLHYALAHWRGADSAALARDLSDFSRYALRPLEWIVPPGDHRVGALAAIGRTYQASRGAGEFFYNYLGLLGAAGLFWAVAASARRAARFPLRQSVLLGLLWLLLFGLPHGLNSWLGALGLDVFRASTRIGVFAAVWIGFFLAARAARVTHAWPRAASIALALGTAVFLVWEQTPNLAARAPREANARRARAYRDLGAEIERTLPAGAKVFQLPAAPFPEAGRIVAMPDYEHLLPMLATRTLRFSFGHLRTSPAHRWENHVARLPAEQLVAALQEAGFALLWIDRRGFADEAVALVVRLRAAGLAELSVPPELPLSLFRLAPVATPRLPDLDDPRLQEPWNPAASADARPLLLALRGWYPPERAPDRAWRWAAREAQLGLWLDGGARRVRLQFAVSGPASSQLRLLAGETEIWRGTLHDGPAQPHEALVTLPSGLTTLMWRFDGRTFRPGGADPRELGFMVENLRASAP
ncbi:MAG: hypothetical protein HYV96_17335 [Opitutae bacterium]|nr:hypothetical protein [Opitutae bacterium]